MKNNIIVVGGGFAGLYTALELDSFFSAIRGNIAVSYTHLTLPTTPYV